ncbi:hypothetical protein G9A89_002824 [Geosiphon pyriformis]|nr:hypothetical protein G9A89_002824 [Geosiphon pyriformis]
MESLGSSLEPNFIDLPVVNVSPLLFVGQPDSYLLSELAAQIHSACTQYGAFYITSFFDREAELNILKRAREFFNLSDSIKCSIPVKSGGFTRGYIGVGAESGSYRFEFKEAFSYGYEWDPLMIPSNPLEGPNEWGKLEESLGTEWRKSLNKFFSEMVSLAELLVKGLELALQIELQKYCVGGENISLMRFFRYFPYSNESKPEFIGSSPHTDWGFLTLLLQPDKITGLQLFYDNEWRDVPSKPGHIVVNCGDYLSLLTRGLYKSPLHRVISDGINERYSMVFFYYPKYDSHIPFVQNTLSDDSELRDLSIFQNQTLTMDGDQVANKPIRQTPNADTMCDLGSKSFGDYIAHKWDQVFRKNV